MITCDCLLLIARFPLFSHVIIVVEQAMLDEISTLKEVAKHLKLAEKTVCRLAAEGKLSGFKVNGS